MMRTTGQKIALGFSLISCLLKPIAIGAEQQTAASQDDALLLLPFLLKATDEQIVLMPGEMLRQLTLLDHGSFDSATARKIRLVKILPAASEQPHETIEELNQLKEEYGESPFLRWMTARCLIKCNELEKAIAECDRLLNETPPYLAACHTKAAALFMMKEFAKAHEALEPVLTPPSREVLTLKAALHGAEREFPLAEDCALAATESAARFISSRIGDCWKNAAMAAYMQQEYVRAERYIDSALAASSTRQDVLKLGWAIKLKNERLHEALGLAMRLNRLASDKPDGLIQFATSAAQANMPDVAKTALNQVLDKHPDNKGAARLLSKIVARQKL